MLRWVVYPSSHYFTHSFFLPFERLAQGVWLQLMGSQGLAWTLLRIQTIKVDGDLGVKNAWGKYGSKCWWDGPLWEGSEEEAILQPH